MHLSLYKLYDACKNAQNLGLMIYSFSVLFFVFFLGLFYACVVSDSVFLSSFEHLLFLNHSQQWFGENWKMKSHLLLSRYPFCASIKKVTIDLIPINASATFWYVNQARSKCIDPYLKICTVVIYEQL